MCFIAQTLVKMNLTEEDYLADNPSAKLTKGSTVHYTLASDYEIENVETCLDAIKMLQRFEKGWRKPSEKTINSTSLSSCAKLSSTTVLQMPTSKSNSSVILQTTHTLRAWFLVHIANFYPKLTTLPPKSTHPTLRLTNHFGIASSAAKR